MKFYQTKEFKALDAEWKAKLEEEGFQDLEKRKDFSQWNRRTIAYQNSETIRDFFIRLDHFLTEHPEIPDLHRKILSLYSEGRIVRHICRLVGRSYTTVRNIIRKYKAMLNE